MNNVVRTAAFLLSFAFAVIGLNSPFALAQATVSGAEARAAMEQALTARGVGMVMESGLTFSDYIAVSHDGEGAAYADMWVDRDGRFIPNPSWYAMNPVYCEMQARYTAGAVERVQVKVFRWRESADGMVRDQTTVFVGVFDAETGAGIEQREAGVTALWETGDGTPIVSDIGTDRTARAIVDAMDQLVTANLGHSLGKPCGDIRLVHESGSKVGEPIVFQAGFPGTYGQLLDYTWDFGDGSESVEIGPRAQHVYGDPGDYVVTVLVEGNNVEPDTAQVVVSITQDAYELYFLSRVRQDFPGGNLTTHYESTIPLGRIDVPPDADGEVNLNVYEGTAPLVNTHYNFVLPGVSCTGVLHDGAWYARVDLDSGDSASGINVALTPPSESAIPKADLVCPGIGGAVLKGMGDTWWPIFVVLNGVEGEYFFYFNDWDTATGDPEVVARYTSNKQQLHEGVTIGEQLLMEIRAQP